MKLFFALIILFLLNSCSFDNKSGIWENKNISSYEKNIFKEFKEISNTEEIYNITIPISEKYIFNLTQPIKNNSWNDIYFSSENNTKNFKFDNLNKIIFKSNKLSKNSLNKYKLFEKGNLIVNDEKGNIVVYSIKEKRIISKYNFYKKKFKKIKKKLNIIVENNVIFVADNLGYFYAYNYELNRVIWAKNYKVPFSSNLKIFDNKIAVSNQNNNLYIIDKKTGDLFKLIPTEETFIKNKFINNLSIVDENKLFFLNSFGSLYSINTDNMSVNWFNNFNKSFTLSPSNMFLGKELVSTDKEIIISTNSNTYLIDLDTGSILKKFNFSSSIKPLIVDNVAFFLTDNNFLIALNLDTKKILYSYDIGKLKKIGIKKLNNDLYKNMMILNNNIFIFLNDSRILIFDIYGNFKNKQKLPSKINSLPININNSILFLNNKNKLVVVN